MMIYDTMIWCDEIWYDIWYDLMWCDMIWYMMWYDMMIWCDVIWYDNLLTAIGLSPGGSSTVQYSTVHIYTQTVHRTTQWNRIHITEHT